MDVASLMWGNKACIIGFYLFGQMSFAHITWLIVQSLLPFLIPLCDYIEKYMYAQWFSIRVKERVLEVIQPLDFEGVDVL